MKESKKTSLFNITDEICNMETDIEKIRVLMKELELEHFSISGIEKGMNYLKDFDSPLVKLVWEYDSHCTMFRIMEDYVYSIYDQINGLRKELEGALKSC